MPTASVVQIATYETFKFYYLILYYQVGYYLILFLLYNLCAMDNTGRTLLYYSRVASKCGKLGDWSRSKYTLATATFCKDHEVAYVTTILCGILFLGPRNTIYVRWQ